MKNNFDPNKPLVAALTPNHQKLEKGTYFWCACGHSKKQPFCDGAHKAFGLRPLRFEVEEPKDVYLCMCKQTQKPPFCDGAHKACQEAGVKPGDQVR